MVKQKRYISRNINKKKNVEETTTINLFKEYVFTKIPVDKLISLRVSKKNVPKDLPLNMRDYGCCPQRMCLFKIQYSLQI